MKEAAQFTKKRGEHIWMEFFHPRRNVNASEVYEMLLNIISNNRNLI